MHKDERRRKIKMTKNKEKVSFKNHLKRAEGMGMPDRLDNELICMQTWEGEAKRLVKKKLGFWKYLFLPNKIQIIPHVSACLFYGDKIHWENLEAW